MKVTIIGAGNMGRAIGTRAVAGGHEVEIVDRGPAEAFNTTFAPTLVRGEVAGQQLDVLIAGDDEDAKRKVSQVVADGGLRPIDAGPLRRARQLEQVGFLHISLQQPHELGFGGTVKLHPWPV